MSSHIPAGERLNRTLSILVVGAFTAATAGLIAIALISRRKPVSKRLGVISGIGAAAKPGK